MYVPYVYIYTQKKSRKGRVKKGGKREEIREERKKRE